MTAKTEVQTMSGEEVARFLRFAGAVDGPTLSPNHRMDDVFTRANAAQIRADRRADWRERIDAFLFWATIALMLGSLAFSAGYAVGLAQTALGY